MMHLYSAFCVLLYTQSALQALEGVSPQPPPCEICERVRKNIVEYFKNNVPQRQIIKALTFPLSSVHNIKRFRETGYISVCKGQG